MIYYIKNKMGYYYSKENDMIATSGLPSQEDVLWKIKNEIKHKSNHGKGIVTINLEYSSDNIGYNNHDIQRKNLDNIVIDYLNTNYICNYKFLHDLRYQRIVEIKTIACYCDICINKHKTNF